MVDEDDDGPRGAASSSSGARGAAGVRGGWDWNKICAYHTNRVVRIQDANLGALGFVDLKDVGFGTIFLEGSKNRCFFFWFEFEGYALVCFDS